MFIIVEFVVVVAVVVEKRRSILSKTVDIIYGGFFYGFYCTGLRPLSDIHGGLNANQLD